jgi:ribonuclease P protein component
VLAAAQRLRRREDFAATIRNGRRAGRGTLVVHYLQPSPLLRPDTPPVESAQLVQSAQPARSTEPAQAVVAETARAKVDVPEAGRLPMVAQFDGSIEPVPADQASARAGFVVSKAVGNAVVRNTVKRRLRHLVRSRIGDLPAGAVLVVRALPEAANARYQILENDFDSALDAARRPKSRGARR